MARPTLKAKKFVGIPGTTSATNIPLNSGWNTGFGDGNATFAPATDDIVIVTYCVGANADVAIGVNTTGYTEEAELYSDNTFDTNLSVSWKRMGATPDTSVDVSPTTNITFGGAVILEVWRGVDTTTAMDVTRTTATGINGGKPNPPSITPTTTDAVVVVCGGAGASDGTAFTQPGTELASFLSDFQTDTCSAMVGTGSFDWVSGAFDPVAWTGGSTAVSASWAAVCLALRPATSAITAEASNTLGAMTLAAAAALALVADASNTLGAATLAADGSVTIQAESSTTLGAVTLSSDALLDAKTADADITLGAATVSADGSLALQAEASPTLGAATSSADGSVAIAAEFSKALGAVALNSSGTVTQPEGVEVHVPASWIRSIEWSFITPSQNNVSGWTGRPTIVVEPWRAKWQAAVELKPMLIDTFRPVRAFLASRKGAIHPFRIAATEGPQNNNSGVSVGITAAQGASSMTISGAANQLKDGQYATVNGQLLMITADQSGSTISFKPPLRKQATAGTLVVTSEPYAHVYLIGSEIGWKADLGPIYWASFEVEEAILEADPDPT